MIKKFNDFLNEGIRDMMTPKSEEEIVSIKDILISNTGYHKDIKEKILIAIDNEMKNPFNKFGSSALGTVKWMVEDDFNFTPNEFNRGVKRMLDEVLKPLIKKYNL